MHRSSLHKTLATALLFALLAGAGAQAQPAKPAVRIYATGGTIAGSAPSSTETANYKAGSIGVQTLIDAVPQLRDVAVVSGEQFANLPSNDITQAILLKLAKALNEQLAQAEVSGAVVTHGTDTLEETAFFLDLTVRSSKPVVVVGAMRPATAISADGPFNLLQAVSLAANPEARGRGTLIVMNDRIGSAFYTTKTNTTTIDTFRAAEQGYLGMFTGQTPHFYYSPATPRNKPAFDVTGLEALPKVAIIYMHEDQDPEQIDAAIKAGAKGIVLAGNGNGSVPASVKQRVLALTKEGFPVVRSSRTGSGIITPKEEGIGAGFYNPQKARILLMLALAKGADLQSLRKYFNG
jgi:L-asparaginase